ncbi:hypothetical protein BESB_034680 [Besnoitia besnoiti]|uniref:Transmembrane protein n=1 Tax=Besnoitia besnoiti TaxID=94643 RepID=A0A2A9MN08_BESBE|nr:hypothetical protein BESB_034680 [Besnoitia besnoiti]PFH37010.1 hypothetical protein BESB_034680 [Besnoitia besnoiti]
MANTWIERHMATIPQLDFLPLKSYNKQMLTDDALKSSVAVVRDTRAAVRMPHDTLEYSNALFVWPLFFPTAVFHMTALADTLLSFYQMNAFQFSAGLSSLVSVGCFSVAALLLSSSQFTFQRIPQGHTVHYVLGFLIQISVMVAFCFVDDKGTVVGLMLLSGSAVGMLSPAGVKAGTKMVPATRQLHQYDRQLCSSHIVKSLSPVILGCLYSWSRPAVFAFSGAIVTMAFMATTATFLLRPRAWGFDGQPLLDMTDSDSPVGLIKTVNGPGTMDAVPRNDISFHVESSRKETTRDPSEAASIARVHQAIKELTEIGEKPAVLPGSVPDADDAEGDVNSVFRGPLSKVIDGYSSPLKAPSRQQPSKS